MDRKESVQNMRILITGVAGYIGSHLADMLTRDPNNVVTGVDVLFFDQAPVIFPLLSRPNFNFIEETALYVNYEPYDVVVHLAAMVGAPICDKYPDLAKAVNVDLTTHILKSLNPHQKLIYPNTNSAYGSQPGVCTEESPQNPLSLYARTKCEGEKIALTHKNTAVLRFATVFGASAGRTRFDLMVNDFIYQCVKHDHLKVFNGEANRNYIHVSDACRAIQHCFDPKITGVFNCGNDEINCTKWELAQRITGALGANLHRGDGEDPDKRDYCVSSQKLYNTGFKCSRNLYGAIKPVAAIAKYIDKLPRGYTRNI